MSLVKNELGLYFGDDYIVNDYQVQINKQGPQMYAVTGFNEGVAGSLYIPEIDVKLEFYNEIVNLHSTVKTLKL